MIIISKKQLADKLGISLQGVQWHSRVNGLKAYYVVAGHFRKDEKLIKVPDSIPKSTKAVFILEEVEKVLSKKKVEY